MADKLFYSMGEVAEMFDVNTSLIRHWESQFSILRPKRNKKGNRLFSPEDVENLKMIYHLVKERGMTLEGAKKALRKAPSESGVDRDAELMERLQRIRALLVEVREDLKAGEGEIVTASDADMTDADAAADAAAADATIAAVKQLSADVGIPTNLHGILKEEDIQFLAESAFADACRPGNPRDTSVEEIVELYKSQL